MSFLFKFAVLIRYIGEMTQKEFEHIAGQMHSKALRVARIYVALEADAEDVAGDVMLKLWAMHEKVPPDDKVEHLVGILTRNRAIDLLRTHKQERSLNESYEYLEEKNQHDELEYKELEQWLEREIDRLPPTNAIILRMRQLEHRELEEIASLLGITKSSVSTLLARARRQLLERIKQTKL
jgi:RNA polymerase sigma-70 factor (ECF subfamily)